MRECVFQANVADFGGAVFRGSTNGDITGSVFVDNKAKTIGGAIYDSHAKVSGQRDAQGWPQLVVQPQRSMFCAGNSGKMRVLSLSVLFPDWRVLYISTRAVLLGPRVQGDISGNTFQGNNAPKGKAIFRTVSAGDIGDNKKLDESTQVVIDNPASN